jgi:uroporphyrinogen-III decarboxylase
MSFDLKHYDYDRHNEQVRAVWEAYHAGKPTRVPVIAGANPRIFLLNPALNTHGITFRQYSEDADTMAHAQLDSQRYTRYNLIQDAEMGPPRDGWYIGVDLQNYYEAAWFGAPVEYRDGQVPDTSPILTKDRKRLLFDQGVPDTFTGGIMKRAWTLYEQMTANMPGYSLDGLPVLDIWAPSGAGTDGPMTVACSLRGATELCMDFYEDPDYARELLRFITEATIHRIRELRERLGHDPKPDVWGFADDSIELLSVDMYVEFVLPCHKMLLSELAGAGPHSIHLCGDVGRLMPTLKRELNINVWDAGFPLDYGAVRDALGPEMQIQTGPKVSTLLHGTPEQVDAECRAILESGITTGGKFILREANNLSPCTPVENVQAMYAAAHKYGMY